MRLSFQIPKRVRLVYFEETGYQLLRNYIRENSSVLYLDPRKSLNVWVALRMILSRRLSGSDYYATFLKLVRPDFIVSLQDNNLRLHASAVYSSQSLVVAIQNGRRGSFSHDGSTNFWRELKELSSRGGGADVIMVFDTSSANLYRHALVKKNPRVVIVGNLANNALDISSNTEQAKEQRLVYISSFPNLGHRGDRSQWKSTTFGYIDGIPLSFDEFFRIEGHVAKRCAMLAKKWSIPFVIIGKRPSWQSGEFQFFSEHLSGLDWTYVPLKGNLQVTTQ